MPEPLRSDILRSEGLRFAMVVLVRGEWKPVNFGAHVLYITTSCPDSVASFPVSKGIEYIYYCVAVCLTRWWFHNLLLLVLIPRQLLSPFLRRLQSVRHRLGSFSYIDPTSMSHTIP